MARAARYNAFQGCAVSKNSDPRKRMVSRGGGDGLCAPRGCVLSHGGGGGVRWQTHAEAECGKSLGPDVSYPHGGGLFAPMDPLTHPTAGATHKTRALDGAWRGLRGTLGPRMPALRGGGGGCWTPTPAEFPAVVPSALRLPGFCHGRPLTSQRHAPLAVAFFQILRVEPPPPPTNTRTTGGESWDPSPCAPGHEPTCAPEIRLLLAT